MATPASAMYEPGPGNVYVPGSTERLHVEFSRNPADYPINRYMQIIPTDKMRAFYAELDHEDAMRIVTINDTLWNDGQRRPSGPARPLKWKEYSCVRHSYSFGLGDLTVDQASYQIIASHAAVKAMKCMTERTVEATTTMTTAGNWPATNTFATLDALGVTSGSWVTSSVTDLFIKKSFQAVQKLVGKLTAGVVKGHDLLCVINPETASKMANTAEVNAYMTGHEQAMHILEGRDRKFVDAWGLPPIMYNIRFEVEDTPKIAARRDVDTLATPTYAFPDDKAVFLFRRGGVNDQEGPPADGNGNVVANTATLVGVFKEEMTVETRRESWDRLTEGSVVDNRDIILSTGVSGVYLQDTTT